MKEAQNKMTSAGRPQVLRHFRSIFQIAFLILVYATFSATRSYAQAITADMVGTVHDQTGSVIPGAEVTLTNKGTNETRRTTSASDGAFAFNLIPPGSYSVHISAPNFKQYEVPDLTLAAGDKPRIDAGLAVGTATETISVEAVSPLLQSESSTLQSSVNQQAVQDLPLNGRNFVQLVQLVPGANEGPPNSLTNGTKPDDKRISASFSANGQSEVLNNQMIDGMDNNESLIGSVGIRPSVSAISEIRVQTAVYSADTGRTGGAAVNIVTMSGTNHIHGSVYEFFRNDIFNTYPYQFGAKACSSTVVYPACNPKQELRQNQFGGSIGGPIFKNKTFYFGDYEGFRLVQGANPAVSTVPTLFEEQNPGNFTDQPGILNVGIIPVAQRDPAALNYLQLFPAPNRGTIGGTCSSATSCTALQGQFVGIAINTQFSNVFDIRLDHQINEHNQLFGRYSYNNVKTWNPTTFPIKTVAGLAINPTGGGYSPSNDHNVSISYIHTFTQNLLMQLQVGYLRVVDSTYPAFFGNGSTSGPAVNTAYGMPGVNFNAFTSGLAHVGWSNGYTTLGGGAFTPLTDLTNAYQGMATVTYNHGPHNFKFGAGLIRRHLTSVQSAAGLPQYTFNDLPTFIQGTFNSVNRLLATSDPRYRRWEPGFYVQDDWHISSNTTLNLGVRYDVYTPFTEIHNNISTWNPVTEVIMVAGTPGVSPTANIRTFYGNVAPRLGFATTVRPGLVVRGGFGIAYYPMSITSNATPKNPPILASYGPYSTASAATTTVPNPNGGTPLNYAAYSHLINGSPALGTPLFANINPASPVGAVRAATDPNFRPGMVEQFTLSIQKEFGSNVLTVAYVGELARHSPQSFTDLNAPPPNAGTNSSGALVNQTGSAAAQALRPYYSKYPNLTNIGWYASEGAGSYHAAQVSFARRLSRGLSFNINYTYARLLDNAVGMSNQNTTAYGYWVPISHSYDYGNSDLDLRNRGVAAINYTLPFAQNATGFKAEAFKAWQINFIGGWNAGQPVTPVNSNSISGTEQTNGGDRPNRVGNPNALSVHKSPALFFNKAAYAGQTLGTLGNSERNTLYGPHYRHVDLSLVKQFPIHESVNLEFRAEGFNITNTANFSTPNVTVQTGSYGTITAMSPAYSPRVLQFALKLLF
jgi:hypothetical protein